MPLIRVRVVGDEKTKTFVVSVAQIIIIIINVVHYAFYIDQKSSQYVASFWVHILITTRCVPTS